MDGIETIDGRKVSSYHILNWIVMFEKRYLEKILVSKHALNDLTVKLRNMSMKEHYARLYGPTMLVTQDRIQDFLGQDGSKRVDEVPKELSQVESAEPGPGKKQRWKRLITR